MAAPARGWGVRSRQARVSACTSQVITTEGPPANKSPAHREEGPPTPGVRDQRDKRQEWPALACKTHLQPPTLVLQALRVPISPFARI